MPFDTALTAIASSRQHPARRSLSSGVKHFTIVMSGKSGKDSKAEKGPGPGILLQAVLYCFDKLGSWMLATHNPSMGLMRNLNITHFLPRCACSINQHKQDVDGMLSANSLDSQ
jgi:hypothetical protein